MNTSSPSDLAEPALAPPGAGIPAIERLVGGAIFAFKRWRGNHDQFAAQFERERRAIDALYHGKTAETLRRRTLIPRLRGLEDSSRFWSVYMTLDHLAIVNTQIAGVIAALARGVVPPGKASTAAVKPRPGIGVEAVAAHEAACEELVTTAAGVKVWRAVPRYAHPWFGPLDAAGWHAMAAMHMGIHRAQIARILAASPEGSVEAVRA